MTLERVTDFKCPNTNYYQPEGFRGENIKMQKKYFLISGALMIYPNATQNKLCLDVMTSNKANTEQDYLPYQKSKHANDKLLHNEN